MKRLIYRLPLFVLLLLSLLLIVRSARAQGCNLLCNENFENAIVTNPGGYATVDASQVPCWQTTAPDNAIEVWNSGFSGVPAYSGSQFIELNANFASTLFQNYTVIPGTNLLISFAHRGRAGTDVMDVEIGPVGGPYTNLGSFSDGMAWGYYTVAYTVPNNLGTNFTLRFAAISTATGNPTVGNFLDAISVNLAGPQITSSQTNIACPGGNNGAATVNVTSGTAPYSYNWQPSGGNLPSATGLSAGNYTCTITDGNGCMTTSSFAITQPQPLNINPGAPVTLCIGSGTTLSATASGGTAPYTYSWSSGTPNVSPVATTTYSVTATDANGCTSPAGQITVSLLPPITIQITNTISICAGQSATLSAQAAGGDGNYTYLWQPGNLQGNNVNVSPASTTTYTLVVDDGCTTPPADANITVNVNPLPVPQFSSDVQTGCAPLCVTLTNNTPGTTAAWSFGDNTSGNGNSAGHCYTSSGTFDPTITVTDGNGCAASLTIPAYIDVHPVPSASFTATPNPTTLDHPLISFSNHSTGADQWSWDFGDNSAESTVAAPQHTYGDTGHFNVTLIATNAYGCSDTTHETVWLVEDYTLYIPNAFTPNHDGKNDLFRPEGISIDPAQYEFMIYDRWGNQIFHTNTWGDGWDGTYKGDRCPDDVYVWRLLARDYLGRTHDRMGHLTLLR